MRAIDTECPIAGCVERAHARGWCKSHYMRWWKYGDPEFYPVRATLADRFWVRVDTSGECWVWLAHLLNSGYGTFGISTGYTVLAHRWAYQDKFGPIPEGLVLDHLCRNRACVRPSHLEAVTFAENVRRGIGGWNMREKTHCPRGHPYSGDNVYVKQPTSSRSSVNRICRTCNREKARAYRQRQKEVAV